MGACDVLGITKPPSLTSGKFSRSNCLPISPRSFLAAGSIDLRFFSNDEIVVVYMDSQKPPSPTEIIN
jgi:hypothetical protein